jgi:hypothetical protein
MQVCCCTGIHGLICRRCVCTGAIGFVVYCRYFSTNSLKECGATRRHVRCCTPLIYVFARNKVQKQPLVVYKVCCRPSGVSCRYLRTTFHGIRGCGNTMLKELQCLRLRYYNTYTFHGIRGCGTTMLKELQCLRLRYYNAYTFQGIRGCGTEILKIVRLLLVLEDSKRRCCFKVFQYYL